MIKITFAASNESSLVALDDVVRRRIGEHGSHTEDLPSVSIPAITLRVGTIVLIQSKAHQRWRRRADAIR